MFQFFKAALAVGAAMCSVTAAEATVVVTARGTVAADAPFLAGSAVSVRISYEENAVSYSSSATSAYGYGYAGYFVSGATYTVGGVSQDLTGIVSVDDGYAPGASLNDYISFTLYPSSGSSVQLSFYDNRNDILNSIAPPPAAAYSQFRQVFLSVNNAGGSVSASNVTASVSQTPEPTTWAMFIGSFALIGGLMRRRPRTSVIFS